MAKFSSRKSSWKSRTTRLTAVIGTAFLCLLLSNSLAGRAAAEWSDYYENTDLITVNDFINIRPAVAVDPNTGTVHMTYTSITPGSGDHEIFYRNNTGAEGILAEPVILTNLSYSIDNDYSDVAVDKNGDAHVVFSGKILSAYYPSVYQIFYVNNTLGDFVDPVPLFETEFDKRRASIEVDENLTVHIMYEQLFSGIDDKWHFVYFNMTNATHMSEPVSFRPAISEDVYNQQIQEVNSYAIPNGSTLEHHLPIFRNHIPGTRTTGGRLNLTAITPANEYRTVYDVTSPTFTYNMSTYWQVENQSLATSFYLTEQSYISQVGIYGAWDKNFLGNVELIIADDYKVDYDITGGCSTTMKSAVALNTSAGLGWHTIATQSAATVYDPGLWWVILNITNNGGTQVANWSGQAQDSAYPDPWTYNHTYEEYYNLTGDWQPGLRLRTRKTGTFTAADVNLHVNGTMVNESIGYEWVNLSDFGKGSYNATFNRSASIQFKLNHTLEGPTPAGYQTYADQLTLTLDYDENVFPVGVSDEYLQIQESNPLTIRATSGIVNVTPTLNASTEYWTVYDAAAGAQNYTIGPNVTLNNQSLSTVFNLTEPSRVPSVSLLAQWANPDDEFRLLIADDYDWTAATIHSNVSLPASGTEGWHEFATENPDLILDPGTYHVIVRHTYIDGTGSFNWTGTNALPAVYKNPVNQSWGAGFGPLDVDWQAALRVTTLAMNSSTNAWTRNYLPEQVDLEIDGNFVNHSIGFTWAQTRYGVLDLNVSANRSVVVDFAVNNTIETVNQISIPIIKDWQETHPIPYYDFTMACQNADLKFTKVGSVQSLRAVYTRGGVLAHVETNSTTGYRVWRGIDVDWNGTVDAPQFAIQEDLVYVAYEKVWSDAGGPHRDVHVANSTNGGLTFNQPVNITTNYANATHNATITFTGAGIVEVGYIRDGIIHDFVPVQELVVTNNYYDYFGFVDVLRANQSANNYMRYTTPILVSLNESISLYYSSQKNYGQWQRNKICGYSYTLLYSREDQAQTLQVEEDNLGYYLFENLDISYGPLPADMPITVEIEDLFSGTKWVNQTVLPKDGGYRQTLHFWNDQEYFISNGSYRLSIYNSSNQASLVRLLIDGTEIYAPSSDQMPHYYLVDLENNRVQLNYSLSTQTGLITGLEWQWWSSLGVFISEGSDRLGTFTQSNNIDWYTIDMEAGETYNFSVSETNASDYTDFALFNSTPRLSNMNNAIWNVSTQGDGYADYLYDCPADGSYYLIVKKNQYQHRYTYQFSFDRCPRMGNLITPGYGETFRNTNVTLNFSVNLLDELEAGYLGHYHVQVSRSADFQNTMDYTVPYVQNEQQASLDLSTDPDFTAGYYYYWRMRVYSARDHHSPWTGASMFKVDDTPPNAPVINAVPQFTTATSLTLSWVATSNDSFGIASYTLYWDTVPTFTPGSNTMQTRSTTSTSYTISNLVTDEYYFWVKCSDAAGWVSALSAPASTIALTSGGEVDRNLVQQQQFTYQLGDFVEYEITHVISEDTDAANRPYVYEPTLLQRVTTGTSAGSKTPIRYQAGDRVHFWIKQFEPDWPIPVWADVYHRGVDDSQFENIDTNDTLPCQIYLTNDNLTYQFEVMKSWLRTRLPTSTVLYSLNYSASVQVGGNNVDARCFTFWEVVEGTEEDQTLITFAYDKNSGVLLELYLYDGQAKKGYSMKLIDTSFDLEVTSSWQGPVYLVIGIVVLIAITGYFIRRLER